MLRVICNPWVQLCLAVTNVALGLWLPASTATFINGAAAGWCGCTATVLLFERRRPA